MRKFRGKIVFSRWIVLIVRVVHQITLIELTEGMSPTLAFFLAQSYFPSNPL